MAYFNVPGCIQESQVAEWGNIYAKLEKIFDKYGVCCVVDSGFGKNKEILWRNQHRMIYLQIRLHTRRQNRCKSEKGGYINAAIGRLGERLPGKFPKNERLF